MIGFRLHFCCCLNFPTGNPRHNFFAKSPVSRNLSKIPAIFSADLFQTFPIKVTRSAQKTGNKIKCDGIKNATNDDRRNQKIINRLIWRGIVCKLSIFESAAEPPQKRANQDQDDGDLLCFDQKLAAAKRPWDFRRKNLRPNPAKATCR